MNEKEIYNLLKIILEKLPDKSFNWHLDGSTNLLIQGIHLDPNDLDITTDDQGIEIFRSSFEGQFDDKYGEKASGRFMLFKINGKGIEINSYEDRKLNKFEKVKITNWKGLKIPILPLKEAKDFYQLIGREERVTLISDYLKNNY